MKYLNREDKKVRKIINNHFTKKFWIKQHCLQNKDDVNLQFELGRELASLPKQSGMTRLKNRCILTCKGRATLRRFKVSHTTFREQFRSCQFPGIKQKSF
jgi:ribosomal protein S14